MTAATHRPLRHTSTAWSRRRAPQSGLILSRRTRTYDRVMARFANAQAEWSTLEFLARGPARGGGHFSEATAILSSLAAGRMSDDRPRRDRARRRSVWHKRVLSRQGSVPTEYGAAAKGSRAVALMRDLRPFHELSAPDGDRPNARTVRPTEP